MSVLLLDTNLMSILFKPDHALHRQSFGIVAGHQWFISFMTRGELLFWPKINHWGSARRDELMKHIDLCTTLFPDDATCVAWADIMFESVIPARLPRRCRTRSARR